MTMPLLTTPKKSLAAAALLGIALFAQTGIVSAAPGFTMQSERALHPRIVKAIENMKESLRELEAAPDDFGGNKAVAIADTRRAIHSLKKALYYRLNMDDAALDRAD